MKPLQAKLSDIARMQNLVADEVARGIILARSDDEVATNIRSYLLALSDENELLGYCALHVQNAQLAEIRSLIVNKNARRMGVGRALVNEHLKKACDLELKQVFTLTYQREFFESLGFKEIDKKDLPAQKIWSDCIKCKHFPNCDEIALIIDVNFNNITS